LIHLLRQNPLLILFGSHMVCDGIVNPAVENTDSRSLVQTKLLLLNSLYFPDFLNFANILAPKKGVDISVITV